MNLYEIQKNPKTRIKDIDANKPPTPDIYFTSGLEILNNRLQTQGGPAQQSRMVKDKLKTLDKAVKYSYQAAKIKKFLPRGEDLRGLDNEEIPALINPNKLKQDYDDKIISVRYDYDFKPGDIFEWAQTDTYWLIYLQNLTELAYFRGDIRKCSYQIIWEDDGELHDTYAAIRGPVETKIDYVQKHLVSIDRPNYSLNILIPKTNNTLKYFQRYSKFYLQNDYNQVCWRVEAVDWIGMPGIIEVNATEYYENKFEDDVDKGIAGSLKMKPLDPNNDDLIKGDTFIKPKVMVTFRTNNDGVGKWHIDKKYPVTILKTYFDDDKNACIDLRWDSAYSGQFELAFGLKKKTVVVESLF